MLNKVLVPTLQIRYSRVGGKLRGNSFSFAVSAAVAVTNNHRV